jgi:hypothetical protein
MGKQSPPPAPDYAAAAEKTGASNLAVAKYTTEANRVNQVGPNGSLTYSKSTAPSTFDQAGYDSALSAYNSAKSLQSVGNFGGAEISAPTREAFTKGGEDTWTATQNYSPEQQKLYDQQQQQSLDLGGLASQGIDFAKGLMSNPTIDESKLAQMPQNAGMSTQQAMMARLAPQQDRERAGMDTQLANQGIMQGSEAWKNAKTQQAQGFNDQQNQAALAGINVDMAARNQGIANQSAIMNQPLNMINALRTGSQVTPQSYVNAPQQATTAGADYLGAAQGLYNAQSGNVNAANAQSAGMMNGAMGAAATYAAYAF